MAEPLARLRRFTTARVALGRAGNALPTAAHLDFVEAHAMARDAVHATLDVDALAAELAALGLPVTAVRSRAPDRHTYLVRPDLGRTLDAAAAARLTRSDPALALVIADGLSATAVQRHTAPFLAEALPRLARIGVAAGPAVIAVQARVALGDAIGARLGAEAVAVLIGERPGLSAPDSLGLYLTWNPRPGRTDAERNCISNIRPAGQPYAAAADTLAWLVGEMRRRRLTGVALKDERPTGALPAPA
ncbi:ethanolamine ammonia-lyase subunit EutC [Elioraea tepidiphila]|uniref:ethanolamine ammonia-lyase subunit EutC n=1 Tax=Elioraea tepidiphila TaxID=457934 RepID=UPI000370EC04|nr:ethanolamine ammonia-lyase subunit EutC [Elioraea tepidiphila]